jgi:hypothetical protein
MGSGGSGEREDVRSVARGVFGEYGGASAEPRDPGLVRRLVGRACSEGSLGGASAEPRDPGLGRKGWLGGGNCVLLERKCCVPVLR